MEINMINVGIYYDRIGDTLSTTGFNTCMEQLPLYMQQKIRSFHKKEDAYLSLLGKLLLLHGLREMGASHKDLHSLKYTTYRRPYFDGGPYFSISHSGEFAVCAVCNECEVGIDIEQIRPVPLEDFQDQWTRRESDMIHQAHDTMDAFYYFWTRKESVIKADGRGLGIALTDFEVINDLVMIENNKWHLQQIEIAPNYKSHIALAASPPATISPMHIPVLKNFVVAAK